MSKKKNTNEDNQAFLAVGIVFFGVAAGFLINSATRAVAIPFFIIGITFIIIALSDSKKKRKK